MKSFSKFFSAFLSNLSFAVFHLADMAVRYPGKICELFR
jgi:hypothetical protein